MNVRKANMGDIRKLIDLKNELSDYHTEIDGIFKEPSELKDITEEHLRMYLTMPQKFVFIADKADEIVGYIAGSSNKDPYRKPKAVGVIWNFYVKRSSRGSGVGRELFNAAVEEFKKNKVSYIEVTVHIDNKDVISIYEGLGFKKHMLTLSQGLKNERN